jgi:hypothetical protein
MTGGGRRAAGGGRRATGGGPVTPVRRPSPVAKPELPKIPKIRAKTTKKQLKLSEIEQKYAKISQN